MEQRLRRAVFDRLETLGGRAHNADAVSLEALTRTGLRRLTNSWRALLASHQPDDDGRCPQCWAWLRRRRWPCRVWLSAHQQLIGETLAKKPRPALSPSPFGRRNPTVVIPRALPAGTQQRTAQHGHPVRAVS